MVNNSDGELEIVGLSTLREEEPGLFDRLRASGVRVCAVESLSDIAGRQELSQAAVVHCHGFRQLIDLDRLRRDMGAAYRCVISLHWFRNGTRWTVPFTNFVSGAVLNRAAHTLHFLSTRSRAEFARRNVMLKPAIPYYVFPLGCRAEEFCRSAQIDEMGSWDYLETLTSGRPNVVYLAAFTRGKQHRWLIDALGAVLVRQNAVLWLFGDGPERSTIQRYVEKRSLGEHIVLPGHVPRRHVPGLLSYMQVAVCPSLSENSPHAIMEPLFAGVPVVTFDVGTASQLVTDFRRGFVLGNPRCQQEFGRKVELILVDHELQGRMSGEASCFAKQFYTWSTCASNTLAMYRAMLR
jgi:glycosyltransferase involved in cell wall biosynthesis